MYCRAPNPELKVTAPGCEVVLRNGNMQVTSLGLSWQYSAGLATAKSTPAAVVETNRTLVSLFAPVNDGSYPAGVVNSSRTVPVQPVAQMV